MSYSTDLRQRVLAAVDRGMSRADVVTTFQVSAGSIKRWLAKRRTTGTIAPTSPPGRQGDLPPTQFPALRAQLEAHPDATLAEHLRRWEATHGKRLNRWTLSRAIVASGWTRKKSR